MQSRSSSVKRVQYRLYWHGEVYRWLDSEGVQEALEVVPRQESVDARLHADCMRNCPLQRAGKCIAGETKQGRDKIYY